MSFSETEHPRATDGKFAEKTGGAPEVALDVQDISKVGVTENDETGYGWRNLRGAGVGYDEAEFAFQSPDGTTVVGLRDADDSSLSIAIDGTDPETGAHFGDSGYFPSQGSFDTADLGPHGDKAAIALRDHLKFVPEFRNSRAWTAVDIMPGDMVDMAPVLERLQEQGSEIDEADLIVADSELFLITDVKREDENTVVLYSESGNYAVPAEELILVEYHDPAYIEDSEFEQPKHPLT
jgi:hypothetical protein